MGEGRYEIALPPINGPVQVKVMPYHVDILKIEWLGLFGHKQVGKIFNISGDESEFLTDIKLLNSMLNIGSSTECRGSQKISNGYYVRSIFNDGWSRPEFELCSTEQDSTKGFRLTYANPFDGNRNLLFKLGIKDLSVRLDNGEGDIHVCGMGQHPEHLSIYIFPSIIPSELDSMSPDVRNLGIFIQEIKTIDCGQKVGVW